MLSKADTLSRVPPHIHNLPSVVMPKKLLSNYHHDDPFILGISKGNDDFDEGLEYFIPDDCLSASHGNRPVQGAYFTPVSGEQKNPYSYIPDFQNQVSPFYAMLEEEAVPIFEPDVIPVVDFHGFSGYLQHPGAQGFPAQGTVGNWEGNEVVELRPEQMVQGPTGPAVQQQSGYPGTGNPGLDAALLATLNPSVNPAFGSGGFSQEEMAKSFKGEMGGYFQEHVYPTLNSLMNITVNQQMKKMLGKVGDIGADLKEAATEDSFSPLYIKDVSRDYSVVKASFWMVAILILLWGIPAYGLIIAPLVAGYVGGRKAGNEFRAFLAALLPTVISTLLVLLFTTSIIPFTSYHHTLVTLHDSFFDIISHLSVYESSQKDPARAMSSITSTGTATFFSMLALSLIGGTMERDQRKLQHDIEICQQTEKKKS